jgi:hypothetical protein
LRDAGVPTTAARPTATTPADRGDHPSTIYVKGAALLPGLDDWLGELFDEEHLDRTCETLAKAAEPDPEDETRRNEIRRRIAALDSYRAVVRSESDAAPAEGKWIAEAFQERRRLETLLGVQPTDRLTKDDSKALVASFRDITAALARADPPTRPPSTPRWASPSPTTKTAGCSSSPGLV